MKLCQDLQMAIRSKRTTILNNTRINLKALAGAPIRAVLAMMPMTKKNLTGIRDDLYYLIAAPRTGPAIYEIDAPFADDSWLVLCDGDALHFAQQTALGALKIHNAIWCFENGDFCDAMTGRPDMDRADSTVKKLVLYWAMAEALHFSPDGEWQMQHPHSHEIFSGHRVAIPPFQTIIIPDDLDFMRGVATRAKANREEIMRTGHAYERTTLSPDNGIARSGYKIKCCRCGTEDEIIASGHTGSLPQTVINKKFAQKGWKTGRKAVGPCCLSPKPARFATEEPMKAKTIDSVATQINSQSPVQTPIAIEAPREMTAADKRKVFRAIDDQWDEAKGRYIGAASDQHIADTLKVPRAWVKDVREENFGKTQRNEELDKLVGDAKNLRAEAARNAATALDLATKFEKLDMAYQDMIRRLEAVE